MERDGQPGPLLARCIVCRGDIHENDRHEVWESGFYCERHSLPLLRERAKLYADMLAQEAATEPQ
jgi:hypothetical protein